MSFGNSYTYNPTLPVSSDYPGNDQPGMQTNTGSTSNLIGNDHIPFNAANGGTHKFLSFANLQSEAAMLPTGAQSVSFPAGGIANPAQAEGLFKNARGYSPYSALKAFCIFSNPASNTAPLVVPAGNGANVGTITRTVSNPLTYTIQIASGLLVTGTDKAAVLITPSFSTIAGTAAINASWSFNVSYDLLTITFTSATVQAGTISVAILQF